MTEELYISPTELDEYKEAFSAYEKNNSGSISTNDFLNFLQQELVFELKN